MPASRSEEDCFLGSPPGVETSECHRFQVNLQSGRWKEMVCRSSFFSSDLKEDVPFDYINNSIAVHAISFFAVEELGGEEAKELPALLGFICCDDASSDRDVSLCIPGSSPWAGDCINESLRHIVHGETSGEALLCKPMLEMLCCC
ncbi:hypothetical protein llap_14141 [Limosa lapponica baueri]|uniref:Uncharacterized protein n=1 Tax=Limosa lapponica baueri TaxID=1758121 RepID=A0A2I0TP67_LIMLA|nr:hypothetical protein llap_14141 [Limosa lapponica baueri]